MPIEAGNKNVCRQHSQENGQPQHCRNFNKAGLLFLRATKQNFNYLCNKARSDLSALVPVLETVVVYSNIKLKP